MISAVSRIAVIALATVLTLEPCWRQSHPYKQGDEKQSKPQSLPYTGNLGKNPPPLTCQVFPTPRVDVTHTARLPFCRFEICGYGFFVRRGNVAPSMGEEPIVYAELAAIITGKQKETLAPPRHR